MEWIKCSERLPEHDDNVLVYNYRDGITLGSYDQECYRSYIEKDGSIQVINTGWEVDYHWAPQENTTHWMPLPDCPKEK